MNGFIARAAAVLGAGAGLMGAGCYGYNDLVDPCYPQRYEFAARQEVKATFAPQVHNGHVLDQTIWNYEFAEGSATLTPGGLDHLAYIARRRPCPDTTLYLEVAQDIPYDPAAPDQFVRMRVALDTQRMQAIQSYLAAQTEGQGVTFTIVRHDPADVGMSAVPMLASVRQIQTTSQGTLVRAGGGGGAGGGSGGK